MIPEAALGELSVLNCCEGDIELRVRSNDPNELKRVENMITDMLRRGYLIFVKRPDGSLRRVTQYDPQTHEYVLMDGPPSAPATEIQNADDTQALPESAKVPAEQAPATKNKRGKKSKKAERIPVDKATATAVPQTAGG